MRHSIAVTVNGVRREDAVEPRLLLVHYLRELAGLTGTHIACDTSQCGACTVLLDGRAVKSCSVLAVQADGRSVTTVEGLARGAELHPLQEAFWAEHGLQCGFCTPGFLMAAADLLAHTPTPTDDEIRRGLEGNICRCTGYENILKAVRAAASRMAAATSEAPAAEPAGVGS
jgi:aerobic carbon-monoxide dehydrogenase small subunit